MNQPLVTIITPSFNQGIFIERTIKSVLNQSYKNIEYIVVDGCSTDDTKFILEKYSKEIGLTICEKDNGQSEAINKGFNMAKGELVGWINSDDTLESDCVEKIVEMYNKNRSCAIFYGSIVNVIDDKDDYLYQIKRKVNSRDELIFKNFDVLQPGSFYNRELLCQTSLLNTGIRYCMDLDLWIRLLEKGDIACFSEKPLANFRLWCDSKTSCSREEFLHEIKKTLLSYGATRLCGNLIKIKYQLLKNLLKRKLF
ncbi:MAG: glycosyltransferase family 2 protein [Bacteroidales bacterium]|nr:glycosyltransferase family 2 protein [Bacteroidales bacterium]